VPVALCVGQIADARSVIRGRTDTEECYANFGTMTLAIMRDDDDGTNGSRVSSKPGCLRLFLL
jgi:hypothetical protein